jgi:hypothetical protein
MNKDRKLIKIFLYVVQKQDIKNHKNEIEDRLESYLKEVIILFEILDLKKYVKN